MRGSAPRQPWGAGRRACCGAGVDPVGTSCRPSRQAPSHPLAWATTALPQGSSVHWALLQEGVGPSHPQVFCRPCPGPLAGRVPGKTP